MNWINNNKKKQFNFFKNQMMNHFFIRRTMRHLILSCLIVLERNLAPVD